MLMIFLKEGQIYLSFLACCQGSKPVLESFSDIQCVFLEDSRIKALHLFIALLGNT